MKRDLSNSIVAALVLFAGLSSPRAWAYDAANSARFNDWNDLGACQLAVAPPDKGGCPSCEGMPRWWVSLPYCSVQIADEPLSYFTSSGAKMSFRWTHQQRGQLNGQTRRRELDNAPYNPLVRYRQQTPMPQMMTNAAWCHNWWSEILVWDSNLEANPPTSYTHVGGNPPQGDYLAYTIAFTACALPGDGGTIFFNGVQSAYNPEPGRKARLEVLGTVSQGQGARIPAPTWNPYPTNAQGIIWVDSTNYGFRIVYPDGSKDVYAFVQLVGLHPINGSGQTPPPPQYPIDNTCRAYLTKRIDPQGRETKLGYKQWPGATGQPKYTLAYVVDPDGLTTTYTYDPTDRNKLQQIQDPYGRSATFGYGSFNLLSSITDAAGMMTSFGYTMHTNMSGVYQPLTGWITNMTTPYGTTYFDYFQEQEPNSTLEYTKRAVWVTKPDFSHELFYYRHNCSDTEPAYLTPSSVPSLSGYTFDNGSYSSPGGSHPELSFRNTYHWGSRQFSAAVPNLVYWTPPNGNLAVGLSHLGSAQYLMAEMKHWLVDSTDPELIAITESVSSDRPPCTNAAAPVAAARTWYAYSGQPQPYRSGTEPLIACIAKQLPDLSTQYERRDYDFYGHLVTQRLSYSAPTSIGELTNTFKYSTNSIDLLAVSNSIGQWTTFTYNTLHQVTNQLNALNQATSFTWDPWSHNLTGVSLASGATVSLGYNGLLQSMTFQPEGRVVEFADYSACLPRTVHIYGTDLTDLWFTNAWDGLNRLTNTAYTDGTSATYIYDRLHIGGIKDRLNNWTAYVYNNLEQLTRIQDARSNITQLTWCDCGSLTSIIDPLNRTTSFFYNNQGALTNVVYPDTVNRSSRTNFYDSIGRIVRVVDGENKQTIFGYNNQGLLSVVSNAYGAVLRVAYDAVNRPWAVTDANGVTVTNQYDLLNRLSARLWQDGYSEGFGYSTNGLIAYTNRNQKVTRFLRDGAGRVTWHTNANLEATRFAYNALDEVTDLYDGRNNHTVWKYNEYGWLTNKTDGQSKVIVRYFYDSNGTVTNRCTPQFGNTRYSFDPNGNLRTITYSNSTVSFQYDPANQLTNMTDAAGTTVFSYTGNGELLNEDGPWAGDDVTYAYKQGRRTSMTLGTFAQSYYYDDAWRLQTLSSPAGSFTYGYSGANPASALVRTLSLPNFSSITNHYDSLGRLDYTALLDRWGHSLDGSGYVHDPVGLRTAITRELGLTTNYVAVNYDPVGQMTNWSAQEASGTLRLHEQLNWVYDKSGNVQYRTNGAFVQTFSNDAANQLTSITRNSSLTLSGVIPAPATSLTVNGQAAALYGDLTFARTTNITGNDTFTIVAQNQYRGTTNSATYQIPASCTLLWDANGNLTNDGTRSFAYDAENQLLTNWVANAWKVEFVYDGLGRRRIMREYGWQGSTWGSPTNEVHYILDGLLPIQERNSANQVLVSYPRGLDFSGGFQAAGGIGGLLARIDSIGAPAYYHADGAGNITALLDQQGHMAARYEYGGFGRVIGKWGALADPNIMQFSSMPRYANSDLSLFPFRAYDPNLQRWLTRDPIGEAGGVNLYGYVGNGAANQIDPYGLWSLHDYLYQAGQGLYDFMMGDPGEGRYDRNMYAQQRAELLGGIDRNNNVLRDSIGEGLATLGGMAKEAAVQYAGGKVAQVGGAVVGDLAGRLICKAKPLFNAAEATAPKLLTAGTDLPNAGGVIRSFAQEGDQVYYRVFSGDKKFGSFLTAVPPKSSAWAQEALSLPPGNTAQYVQKVLVPNGTLLQRSRALPVPEWGRFRGGAEQFQILPGQRLPSQNFGEGVLLP